MFKIVTIQIPYQLMLPVNPLLDENGQPGLPNEFYGFVTYLNDHCPNWIDGVHQKTYRGTWDGITYTYVAEIIPSMLTLAMLEMIRSVGGDVINLATWAKVDPESPLPERYADGRELTWQQYIDESGNRTFAEFVEGHFIATAMLTGQDKYPPYSQLVADFGVQNLLTEPMFLEMQANQPVPEPEPEDEEPLPEPA